MEITLNNNKIQTQAATIQNLIDSLNLKDHNIVVELNLQIIKKVNWAQTTLHKGDNIEIITFMGGG
ncbi:MAG: sulfur carrier protein ThiS [Sulfurospirillaceae bacterium]|nr:sulfur carrier protein ThiS [Sulfurospirillaceae bacterium]